MCMYVCIYTHTQYTEEQWQQEATTPAAPSARFDHAMAVMGTTLYISGGKSAHTPRQYDVLPAEAADESGRNSQTSDQ
jgi:DhnA family fructose-bisphosphate aldolase class Ia